MKGIVLAGGTGSRLWPITWGSSKQLLHVYDKPMVHYPIATLMLAGIRDILIITTPQDSEAFKRVLGSGKNYGIRFHYRVQNKPEGIGQAILIAEDFIKNDSCALILGDNIFYGIGLGRQLTSISPQVGATIFAYKVKDPGRYGVVEIGFDGKVISIEEKPEKPRSRFAVPGLYFYDSQVVDIAKRICPSERGELEITDINREYLRQGLLSSIVLPRGTSWLDTGTFESLNDASAFIRIIEDRQGLKVACLEEIAWRNSWISDEQLLRRADDYGTSPFGQYLRDLVHYD